VGQEPREKQDYRNEFSEGIADEEDDSRPAFAGAYVKRRGEVPLKRGDSKTKEHAEKNPDRGIKKKIGGKKISERRRE